MSNSHLNFKVVPKTTSLKFQVKMSKTKKNTPLTASTPNKDKPEKKIVNEVSFRTGPSEITLLQEIENFP
jgi:hypothetical protein